MPTPALALLSVLAFVRCEPSGAGPCVHTYEDPVLAITSATSSTGAVLDSVVIEGLTVDGRSVEGSTLLSQVGHGVDVRGDGSMVCRVDCGFGTEVGTYRFTASVEGYQAQTVTVEAKYAEFDGGCPSSNAGSTHVSLQFTGSV